MTKKTIYVLESEVMTSHSLEKDEGVRQQVKAQIKEVVPVVVLPPGWKLKTIEIEVADAQPANSPIRLETPKSRK